MKSLSNGSAQSPVECIIQKDKQERLAAATLTTDILSKLNISIEALPQKYQQQLTQVASAQSATRIDQLDPIALSLCQSTHLAEQLDDEYTLLKLRQKDTELQTKIDRNNRILDELRMELESSRSSLTLRSPNPEGLQDAIRQLKQKVASYEESCEKAKVKYSKLPITDSILPQSIVSLAESLATLQEEEAQLQARADDIKLAREARHTLNMLRR